MSSLERVIVNGGLDDRPDQVASIATVFGEPYEVGGTTLIPVTEVRRFMMGHSKGDNSDAPGSRSFLSRTKPVAVIEVEAGQVRIVRVPDPLPVIIGGMLVGAWNIYWILRTIREWRARR